MLHKLSINFINLSLKIKIIIEKKPSETKEGYISDCRRDTPRRMLNEIVRK